MSFCKNAQFFYRGFRKVHTSVYNISSKVDQSSGYWSYDPEGRTTNRGIAPTVSKYDIYCRGELLHRIQMSDIFEDSKTFVDKKLKHSSREVIRNYENFKKSEFIELEQVRQFVEENFEDVAELEMFEIPDWVPYPTVQNKILDANLKNWASELNGIWKHLARRNIQEVKQNPDLFSVIHVPNGTVQCFRFIIPGGRFREIYYWDTYWITNGVLICDMIETAKGMIENLLHLVNVVGHVPNGARIYYEERSQPPMLTLMVQSYYKRTHDFSFISSNIHLLDKEMNYWIETRTVKVSKNGVKYTLYRYFANSPGPRPESYKEDLHSASLANNDEERQERYTAIKTAAESGWDFSTRWFILNGENKGNLSNMSTQFIVPVDLNAILHQCFKFLHQWYKRMGDVKMAKKYYMLSTELLTAIETILWDDEEGIWMDYDISNNLLRDYFYMSNFVPLWTKSYTFSPEFITQSVLNYMDKYNLDRYTGGSPTSTEYSGEQWDFPNAWPPLQAFMIMGLDKIGTFAASEVAFFFADKYLHSNYKGFKELGVMFEKYDSLLIGRTGDGGEYDAQEGFGWTNGVVFEFLERWGDRLRAFDTRFAPRSPSNIRKSDTMDSIRKI